MGGALARFNARLQAAKQRKEARLHVGVIRIQRGRYPQIRAPPGESLWHDPDKRPRRLVEHEGAAHNAGVQIELLGPELVRHHKHGRSAGLVMSYKLWTKQFNLD